MFCKKCGAQLTDGAVVCIKCGCPPNSGNNYCPSCGIPINSGQVVCVKCGCAIARTVAGNPNGGIDNTAPQRIMAAVFALFLGELGIHKFYMKRTTAGIITLIATICTCGAFGIVAFIEAIIYFTKTDEQFYNDYVVNQKNWF